MWVAALACVEGAELVCAGCCWCWQDVDVSGSAQVRAVLLEVTGQRTVPQVRPRWPSLPWQTGPVE
jgi:hypothetical protein